MNRLLESVPPSVLTLILQYLKYGVQKNYMARCLCLHFTMLSEICVDQIIYMYIYI